MLNQKGFLSKKSRYNQLLQTAVNTMIWCTSMPNVRLAPFSLLPPKLLDFQDVNSRSRSAGKSGLRTQETQGSTVCTISPAPYTYLVGTMALM